MELLAWMAAYAAMTEKGTKAAREQLWGGYDVSGGARCPRRPNLSSRPERSEEPGPRATNGNADGSRVSQEGLPGMTIIAETASSFLVFDTAWPRMTNVHQASSLAIAAHRSDNDRVSEGRRLSG
jgi:hypothetical protein